MTLQDFINQNNEKIIGDGQCGTLVRQYAIEVQGVTPISYTAAKDYWFNPVPGYTKVSTPQDGDWAIYNAHPGFPYGHMGVYYHGEIFEQNADSDGSPAHLFPRANTYLLGYLRKGEIMQKLDPNQVPYIFSIAMGNEPVTQADYDSVNAMSDWQTQLNAIFNDDRSKRWTITKAALLANKLTVVINGTTYVPQ